MPRIESKFYKMHAYGNDFLVFDERVTLLDLKKEQIIELSDRKRSIGFDQLVLIRQSKVADCSILFFNSDGSESSACGNATRCIGKLICEEIGSDNIKIDTKAGVLKVQRVSHDQYEASTISPIEDWKKIRLSDNINNREII